MRFNSKLVRLEGKILEKGEQWVNSFNSKLVRLEGLFGVRFRSCCPFHCFNSKLVRLEGEELDGGQK